ncbi:MAG: Major Facilitator Superfamily protein [Promethearchaeota archaeon]|nr:MAG: Major Facilitator Superfamily protein [Candidatus Lokiarchaeota archaeon]
MSEKLSRKSILFIALFSLAGEIAWAVENQYYNVFLYNVISPNPIYISIMVAVTTTVGTIATIIMGSYSDVIGKRKPLLLYGFILWAITTAIFPLSAFFTFVSVGFAVFLAIFFDSVMTFFGGTAKNAGVNSYITDITTLNNRSKAVGVGQMMTLVALLIVYGASGFLINLFGYYIFFYIIGALVGVFGIIAGIYMEEPDSIEPLEVSTWEHIRNTFKKENFSDYRNFIMVLLVICVWQIGLNTFFPFILIYLQHNIGLSIEISSIVVFIAILASIIFSYPIGALTDKLGRKKVTLIAVLFFSFSVFLFGLASELIFLLLTGIMWLFGYTSLSIATFSWIKDLYPDTGRGQFSGYWNLFAGTIPMVIGAPLGGWLATQFGFEKVIDGRLAQVPGSTMFIVGAIIILLTLIPLIFAKEFKKEPKKGDVKAPPLDKF